MSLTITNVSKQDVGNGQRIVADVLFDASYPHGGEVVTAKDLGFRVGSRLDRIDATGKDARLVEFVPGGADDGKLLVRDLIPARIDYITTRPLLAIGTVAGEEIKITNIVRFIVAGALSVLELAAAEFPFNGAADDIANDAATAQERWYLLSSDDGIAVVVTPGTIADVGLAVPPAIPADHAAIGLVKIVVEAGAVPFNATTDALDDSHLTTTFEDFDGQVYQGTDLATFSVRVVAEGR